jgi:hypothetical protein
LHYLEVFAPEPPVVLNELVDTGFKIYNFSQEKVELEEIFLSI